jgi:AcrR family transcriptional regulator
MAQKTTSDTKGRPRLFDPDRALECALKVFLEKGYEGASLSDLTEAMGINRPSLYATFGDKSSLFHKALEQYSEGSAHYLRDALQEKTSKKVAEALLRGAAKFQTDPDHPPGCLGVNGALVCGKDAQCVRRELISWRSRAEELITQRLKQAKVSGDLPSSVNPADLSRFLTSVIYGMSVRAVSGASRAELMRIAKTALRAWPSDEFDPTRDPHEGSRVGHPKVSAAH